MLSYNKIQPIWIIIMIVMQLNSEHYTEYNCTVEHYTECTITTFNFIITQNLVILKISQATIV